MEHFLLILLGFFVGALGTVIGAGGGFILVPVLLLCYPHMPTSVVTSISLAVVFLNATSGSVAYARMKRIDYKSAFIFSAATLPGSIIGAFTTGYFSRQLFDTVLGILLLGVAIFLILNPEHSVSTGMHSDGKQVYRTITEEDGKKYEYSFNPWIGTVISFFVGFLSSLLGIGGGIIHVPALTGLLNFPVPIATATSHFILAIMALAGTVVHIIQGSLLQEWLKAVLIGVGVIAGAQVGAALSHTLPPKAIIRALAVALLIVGVRLLFF